MHNSSLKSGDKLGKIQPVYRELNKKFIQFGLFHNKLSVDEPIAPYYGNHSPKSLFMRN